MTNFKLFQIGSSCKQQFKLAKFMTSVYDRVENIGENGRKCWLPAFSLFPTMFSKGFFIRQVKSRDCFVTVMKISLEVQPLMRKRTCHRLSMHFLTFEVISLHQGEQQRRHLCGVAHANIAGILT